MEIFVSTTFSPDKSSLKESLIKLKELVNDVNPAAKVHIQLSELREFNIKVIGHLDKPGLYTTNGASRISSIYDQIIYDQHENQKLLMKNKIIGEENNQCPP